MPLSIPTQNSFKLIVPKVKSYTKDILLLEFDYLIETVYDRTLKVYKAVHKIEV